MNMRQLLSASILYGVADVLVLMVSGFLLLPLYTRVLSQADFGAYVAVRANTDILSYVLYLGLPSAVTRLYFDHRQAGQSFGYLRSIVSFFALYSLLFATALFLFGDGLWHLLSPAVSSHPFIWFSFGIAALGFLGTLGSLIFRLDERPGAFAVLQLASAIALAAAAIVALKVWCMGVEGVLAAILVGSILPTLILFSFLVRRPEQPLRYEYVVQSLRYSSPFVVSYLSYFVLNRLNTLILQHHVSLGELAVFGLAQQISLMIAILSSSFGKALQPIVFGAAPDEAPAVLYRSGRVFVLLMFGVTSGLLMFAHELVGIIAPKSYNAGLPYLYILVIGNLVYSFTLVSGTTLEYLKKPNISAFSSTIAAALAAVLGLTLVPLYHLYGAAASVALSFLAAACISHIMAYRLMRQSYFVEMIVVTIVCCGVALFTVWIDSLTLTPLLVWLIKAIALFVVVAAVVLNFAPRDMLKSWVSFAASLRAS